MKQIYTTTLRLNLTDEDDRRAYEHLQQMDKKKYRSYSKAIVAAINDHFDRQNRLASDPYLETREKEDAFLQRVMEVIGQGLRSVPAPVLQFAQSVPQISAPEPDDEELSAALDFADSFLYYDCPRLVLLQYHRGHFYYHEKFITDSMKIVIPSGRIFGICLLSNEPIFTITGGFLWLKI